MMEVKLAEVLTLNVTVELLECPNSIRWFLSCAVSSRETAQLYILVLYQLIWNFEAMLYYLIESIATRPVVTVQNWNVPFCLVWGDEGNPLSYTVLSSAGDVSDAEVQYLQ